MQMQWPVLAVAVTLTLGASGCGQAPPAQTAVPAAQAPAASAEPAPAPAEPATMAPAAGAPPAAAPSASSPVPAPAPAPSTPPPAGGAAPTATPVPEATAPAAAPEPEPEYKDLTVPAGTTLSVVLDSAVSSDGSSVEDTVRGHLANSVRIGEIKALPAGSKLVGTVVEAQESAKVKGRARVAFRFDRITAHGEGHSARTSVYAREAEGTKGKDAKKIGVGAGAGAIVGGIIGGGKGAAIGAGVGGGAGTAAVLATKGKEIALPAGTRVTVRLEEPVRVRVLITP